MRFTKYEYEESTLKIAKKLLGSELVVLTTHGLISGIITETEAYTEEDPASHSYKGSCNSRNNAMYLAGGHIYVYLIYGLHYCLNIVTEREGRGCAVLIRGLKIKQGFEIALKNRPCKDLKSLSNGPGKLCQAMGVSMKHNKMDSCNKNAPIYINKSERPLKNIQELKRIGITKAQNWLWRFKLIDENL